MQLSIFIEFFPLTRRMYKTYQINQGKGFKMKKLMMGALLTLSVSTYAVDISVNNVTCTGAYATGTICDQLDDEIQGLVEGDLPDVSIGKYGTGVANANGFSYRGLTSDYSDKFDFFMVRAAGGVAVEGDIDEPESASGFGIAANATVGLNLDLLPIDKIGFIELDKLDIFMSFMSQSLDQDAGDGTVEGDISSFGVMARYHLIEGKDFVGGNMLSWGGVFVHTGIQRSSFEIDLTQAFDDETVEVSGQDATFGDSSASFTLESTNFAIPVEVSTYIRMAWALTFFGGAGFDIVSGSTDVELNASGSVEGSTGGTYRTDISASDSDSGDADATNFRAFVGGQLNLPFFRVFVHANKGLGNDLLGVNLGAKILW